MTIEKFIYETENRFIDWKIALENSSIIKALKDRNDKKIIEILDTEF